MKLPGETSSYTSRSTLTSTCTDSSTLPCSEVDTTTSFYSSAVTRTFYDGQGRTVETLKPGPDASHTTVSFTVYNDAAHTVFTSLPFVVNSTTSWIDPNGAVDDTGAIPGGTSTALDPLGRTLSVTDALLHQSSTTYGLGSANGDSTTYATVTGIDANSHVQTNYQDVLAYLQTRYGACTGISFIDSTSLEVCDPKRINQHRVFATDAKRGKNVSDMNAFLRLHE